MIKGYKILLLIFAASLFASALPAQDSLSLSALPLMSSFGKAAPTDFTPANSFQVYSLVNPQNPGRDFSKIGEQFLPVYARKNPSGNSFLCRMELSIENQLPLGIWLKAGDSGGIINHTGNNLYFRLKLRRF